MKIIVAIKLNGKIKYQGNNLNSLNHKINYSQEVKLKNLSDREICKELVSTTI